jgi:hypothetical protein
LIEAQWRIGTVGKNRAKRIGFLPRCCALTQFHCAGRAKPQGGGQLPELSAVHCGLFD